MTTLSKSSNICTKAYTCANAHMHVSVCVYTDTDTHMESTLQKSVVVKSKLFLEERK